jgi:endonuclease YncB( thermonuclease family)
MFRFWKRDDGFEWHKYVRTTIKLRRQDRRAKVLEGRDVAVERLKQAGRAGAAAATRSISSLGQSLRRIMQATFSALLSLPAVAGRAVSGVLRPIGRALAPMLAPVLRPFCRPGIPLLLAIIGVLAGISAVSRFQTGRLETDVLIAGAVALAAFTLVLAPVMTGQHRPRLPAPLERQLRRIPASARRAAGFAGLALVAAGGGYLAWSGAGGSIGSLASLPSLGGKTIEGRASAVGGDVLKVGNTLVRLSGIEVPMAGQRCTGPGKRTWRCAEAASEGLAKAVRGRVVRCDVRGTDEAGRVLGRCTAGSEDIAERLVREGSVFAAGSLFARYGSAESEARAQKAGLWRSSEVERPADYRAKLWETARKAAPEGCPIKGQVTSERRTYVLPWSPDYDRVKVRTTRGERWFCSESEAAAAGFKLAERG